MPTYTELNTEACWRAQFTPPALLSLAVSLRARYKQTGNTIGSPGDNRHLNGSHRSRRWIRESRFCNNRTYTVSSADDRAGDENWYSGIDIWPGSQTELLAMCKRLDAAVRAGELEEIAAWYGNIDGDQRVDGYDNILNRLASSDSSHLTHLHITFKRRYANDTAVMARVLVVLTGDKTIIQEDDMHWFAKADREGHPATKLWFGDLTSRRLVESTYRIGIIRQTALVEGLGSVVRDGAGNPLVRDNCDGMGPELGVLTVDAKAVAAELKALGVAGATVEQVEAAMVRVQDRTQGTITYHVTVPSAS
jgi:hypothetical protein